MKYKTSNTGRLSTFMLLIVTVGLVFGFAACSSDSADYLGEGVILSTLAPDQLPQMPQIPITSHVPEAWNVQGQEYSSMVPAVLKFTGGKVNVQRDGKSIESQDGMELLPGDWLIVEKEASAFIHFFEGSTSVLEGPCEAEFLQSTRNHEGDTQIELQLDKGSIVSKIGKLFSSNSSHKIRTSNAVIGAWGTVYEVAVTSQGATVSKVSEGKIGVAYVAEDRKGQPETITITIAADEQNVIEIPPIDEAVIRDLAQILGLSEQDIEAILDYLDTGIDAEHAAVLLEAISKESLDPPIEVSLTVIAHFTSDDTTFPVFIETKKMLAGGGEKGEFYREGIGRDQGAFAFSCGYNLHSTRDYVHIRAGKQGGNSVTRIITSDDVKYSGMNMEVHLYVE